MIPLTAHTENFLKLLAYMCGEADFDYSEESLCVQTLKLITSRNNKIVVAGPPATGKSLFAQMVYKMNGAIVQTTNVVPLPRRFSKYVGGTLFLQASSALCEPDNVHLLNALRADVENSVIMRTIYYELADLSDFYV